LLVCTRRFVATGLISLPLARAHAATAAELAASPISRMDLPWWRRRFEEKQARLRQGAGLLWLGDSITQNWEKNGPQPWAEYAPVWERFYGSRNAVNLGFVGDTTASLLWRLRNLDFSHARPHAAVMLIGANNFGRVHWSADATVGGIAANIAEVHRRLPTTHVLLLGVLPSDRGPWVAEQTRATNQALAARYGAGGQGGVTFMDLTTLFTLNGKIDTSKFYDPLLTPPERALHPTAAGMQAIAQAIEPTLAKLMA
jgi:lysophospholipase L1-like esterase